LIAADGVSKVPLTTYLEIRNGRLLEVAEWFIASDDPLAELSPARIAVTELR
jgi:hypothetical protein